MIDNIPDVSERIEARELIGIIVEVHRFPNSGPTDGVSRSATEISGWLR